MGNNFASPITQKDINLKEKNSKTINVTPSSNKDTVTYKVPENNMLQPNTEICNITETDKTQNNNINITQNHSQKEEVPNRKLEFKLGTSMLNIIGAILILISMITFGKYVYTNYMSDLIKGVFLFVVSACTLLSGEMIFKKKQPKFASGICALGVGALYVSILINYLILDNIDSVFALVLTIIITSISLYLSYKDHSNIIRIIGLLGAYMCLFPIDHLYGISSYITITILIIISIANGCFPIRNKIFLIYSSIINVAFCELISTASFLEITALQIYLLATLIINNIMYMKLLQDDDDKYYAVDFISSLSLIILILAKGDLIFRLLCLLVLIALYYISKNRLKMLNLTNCAITSLSLLFIYKTDLGILFTVLYVFLMALVMIYLMKNEKNIIVRIYFAILVLIGLLLFIGADSVEVFLYGAFFATMIWFLSDKHKNSWILISFKYIYLALLAFIIVFVQEPFLIQNNIFLSCAISVAFILLTNNVQKLKHDTILQANFIVIIITFFICIIIGLDDICRCLVSLVLGSMLIVLFTSQKYIDSKWVLKHKIMIYSIYSTYSILALFMTSEFTNTVANIIFSITLMAAAFIYVWVGFKFNTIEVRRYGLILSLIVCGKLLIIDFYSFKFLMKSILFLVVGIIALAISYVYSKLENKLKNKED